MDFPQASRYTEKRDVVLVGYRGVDGSSILDRPEVESPMAHSSNFLSDDSLREQADGFSSCATRLRDDGVDLEGYTLTQRVEDLEAARRASATSASAQPAVLRSSPSGPRARVEALA